jgi:signal transduction histidine kinase
MNDGKAPLVLVVDDTEGNRYTLARVLRGAGMRVVEGANGRDAFRLVAQHPDLIVLDINLPDTTGYDIVRQLKAAEATASIPVMHVSATFTGNAHRALGLEAGADAYLTHPIDPPLFLATVGALLRAGRADDTARRIAREWVTTFDAISDAILLLDDQGIVIRCNRAAAQLLEREPPAVIGRPLRAVAGDALAELVATMPEAKVEIEMLGRWFAVTVDRVGSVEESPTPVACILADITARKQADRERETLLAEAEQARHEAEMANRSKSDFLAMASHELRTPLNAIAGFVELLALGIRGPLNDAQRADLDKIRRSQLALTALIEDLLSFARIERGTVTLNVDAVVVHSVIVRVAEMIEPMAQERGVRFRCDDCPPTIRVRADDAKVQQVLLNLLSNALKFTAAGGSVHLSCAPDGAVVHLRIADTGRGIPADKLEAIFEPFVQVDPTRARDKQGIGLGLAIGRELARAMGGEITVESVVGQGSTFTLTLPAAPSR